MQGAAPVDAGAPHVQPGEGRGEAGDLVAVAAERGEDGDGCGAVRTATVAVEDRAGRGGQGAVGAQLQVGGGALAVQGAYRVGEPDGGADLAHPVLRRAQFLGGGEVAGDGGDHRQDRSLVGEAAGDAGEVVEHGLHARRVEGVADPQGAGATAVRGEAGGDAGHLFLVARDHHGAGAVDGGEGDAVLQSGQEGQHLVLGGLDGDHGAAGRERGHEATACGDEGAGVLQGEHSGDVGGGDLSDGVARQAVGGDAPGLHEPVQGHFEGEQGGLGVRGVVQEGGLLGALRCEEDLAQRTVELLVEAGEYGVQGVGEDGMAFVQTASHGGALAALPGEEEGQAASRRGTGDQGGVGGAVAQCGQRALQCPAVVGQDGGPVFQGGAGGGQRVGHVRQRQVRVVRQVVEETGGLLAQGVGRAGGQHHGDARGQGVRVGRRGRRRGCGLGRLGGLLDDGVDVGAGQAEGGDARPVGAAGLGPGPGLGGQLDGAGGPVDVAGGVSTCRVRGTVPWRIAMTVFMTPAMPEAIWVWPMLDFTEPSSSGRSPGRSWP